MLKKLKSKRIIAFILLMITILSTTQPIFAASGTGKWVGGQFASYIKTTDNANSQYGVLLRKLINYTTNEQKTVFCAEHGVDFDTGTIYSGSYYTPVNSNIRKACKIAYLGWYKQHGNYVINGGTSSDMKKQYVLTQQFIWETLGQSSATFIDGGIQAEYVSFKGNIENQIAQMERRPSFDGTTINIQAGDSKTLNDSNGVLSVYPNLDKTTNGIRVQHTSGSNSMTISVDENTNLENYAITDAEFKSWGMIKDGTQDEDSMVYFEFSSGVQNQLYSMAYNDPITLSFGLSIETFGKLELQKLNTNGDLVNGAVFNVTGPNGYNQDITVTNGKITIDKLRKGIYTITEKSAPNGYLLNTQAYNVEVKVNQTATQAIVNNEPTGTIQVIKKSEQGDLIKGTIFKIIANENIKNVAGTKTYYTEGQVIANITTDSRGLAEITNLPLGKYVVEETQATTGYLLDSTKHNVTLSYKGQTEKIVLESFEKIDTTPTGEIKVYKTDDYNNKLKGAEISLYAKEDIKNVAGTKTWYKKGDFITKAVTNDDGMVKFSNLHLGKYYVKETNAPEGYLLNTKEFDAELKYKDQTTKVIYLDINNVIDKEPTGTIQVIKKSEQGDLIKGTIFKVIANENIKNVAGTKTYYREGQVIANITTDSKGLAEITNLPLGKYVVEETQATTGYLLDSTKHNITLSYKGQTEKIVLESFEKINTTPTGEIKVYKTDDYNNKLKGAEISLYAREDIKNVAGTKTWYKKGDLITKAITNDEGIVKFSDLHLGKYYVKETNAPEGYLLNTKEFDAELKYKDQDTKVIYLDINNVIDKEPTGNITIIKKDSKTGSIPQGDAMLTGAVYKVYAKEDIYNKARTKKFYSNGDLVATRTMNEKGTTEDITNLPLGKYVVKEETASLGYMLDTKEYEINLVYKDQNTKVISNTATSLEKVKEMGVHIFKSGIKENSGLTPGLESAEFTIKLNSAVEKAYEQGYSYAEVWNGIDEDGNQVKVDNKRVAQAQVIAPTYEVIKTDSDGNAYTQNKLPYGKYIVKETKTPTDYETAVDFTFSITNDESEVNEIAKKIKHLVVNNEQLETYIKIIKKDIKTGKLVTLNSTTFEIKATKDIYDRATKKILFKKGKSISQKVGNTTYTSFTTNADNILIPNNSYNSKNDNKAEVTTPLKLPVGSYEITEIKVPDGFLQLDKSVKFDIKNVKDYDIDKDGDFIKDVIVKNEQPTGIIKLDKTIALREDINTSLIDTSDLSSIEFKLLAKEDIIDKADGSKVYKKGQEIKKYNLTKDGKLTITSLPMGIYEIVETKTLDGLVLDTTKYEVKLEQKDLITKVYTEKLNISNDTTLVEFSKTDVTGNKELKGAKLSVLDSENNVIDTWTSTDKTHKIEGLTIGKEYILKEEIAPEGYVIATSVNFTIDNTNEIQKVNMKDKIVSMSKTDIGGNEVEGAIIQIIDKGGNIIDEWTSTKEEHKIKNLVENETYTLHEETAPNGFVKATDVTFKVTDEKKDQHIELINKVVEISKEDISSKEIEGAKLQVLDVDGNVIDEWISEKEAHKVTGLEENKTYKLHEELAVGNYVKATDIEFKVTTDKETQRIVMIDKLVEVTKTDITNGNELEGAELEVTDEDGKTIDKWTSTKEPHQVKGLEEGKTYILKETTAPYGYEITEEIKFIVTTDKETQKIEMKDMPILKNVKVIKVDSETKEIIKDKFVFGIYEDSECTKLIKEVKSNKENGTALFEELRFGTYYIKEIKAPKDYELSDKIVKVEINDKGIFVDDTQVEENENTIEFTFENKKIEVPKTGDESNMKFIAVVIILSLLGIAYIVIHNYKKNKQD